MLMNFVGNLTSEWKELKITEREKEMQMRGKVLCWALDLEQKLQ